MQKKWKIALGGRLYLVLSQRVSYQWPYNRISVELDNEFTIGGELKNLSKNGIFGNLNPEDKLSETLYEELKAKMTEYYDKISE